MGDGKSVARGGYGRFYDKSHLELIGGLWTPPRSPTRSTRPSRPPGRISDRATASCRPIRSWSNGPTINYALLNQLYPGGAAAEEYGATWDNEDRAAPTPTR